MIEWKKEYIDLENVPVGSYYLVYESDLQQWKIGLRDSVSVVSYPDAFYWLLPDIKEFCIPPKVPELKYKGVVYSKNKKKFGFVQGWNECFINGVQPDGTAFYEPIKSCELYKHPDVQNRSDLVVLLKPFTHAGPYGTENEDY